MSKLKYSKLLNDYRDISILNSIRGVLSWDIETSKMPAMGLKHRSEQFGLISKFNHRFWNSKEISNLLISINEEDLDDLVDKRNLELLKRTYKIQREFSEDLIIRRSSQANTTNEIWKKAKNRKDFSLVKPDLTKLIEVNKEYANKLAEIKDMNDPFDALIDQRDEGMTSKKIKTYFEEARGFLVPFIKKHRSESNPIDRKLSKIVLPHEEQIKIAHEIAAIFRYPIKGELARGNIDEVEHPLTIGCGPDDVRITLKYGQYLKVISSTNHELGHGIHGLNKNPDWRNQPVNDYSYPSLGECNSRYTENKIGKCKEFYDYFLPRLNKISNSKFGAYSVDEFFNSIIRVEPGTSRIGADEVTYGLHIIIRFEIEKLIFDEAISVDELPYIWNEKYNEYLGVDVTDDTSGILQDLHWFSNYYGYFHGYFMGDLLGSQFHTKMEMQIPSWKQNLAKGDLQAVLDWHSKNIYSKGALYTPFQLLEKITGEDLNVKYFKNYLIKKYEG